LSEEIVGELTSPANSPEPRTITLDGTVLSEEIVRELTSWLCSDLFDRLGRVLVEVGTFSDSDLTGIGFVIYDGGNSGSPTSYSRKGINHRWDWGPNGIDFAFVVKPDGTGLFYDFTNANGESVAAKNVFTCRQP
jgi:hypothetical protein